MTAHLKFVPETVTLDLHMPKGTKVAEVKVVGVPEGQTVDLHMVDNASRRVELSGNDIILSQNLVDDSDMSITVEAPYEGSFIDNTLKVQVRVKGGVDRAILQGEISKDNSAPTAEKLVSNASANNGDVHFVEPWRVPGAAGKVQTTEPQAFPTIVEKSNAYSTANNVATEAHKTANFTLDSEGGDIGANLPHGHSPTEPMTVANAQNRANTTENKVNTKVGANTASSSEIEGDARNANAEFRAGRVDDTPPPQERVVEHHVQVTRDPKAVPDAAKIVKDPSPKLGSKNGPKLNNLKV